MSTLVLYSVHPHSVQRETLHDTYLRYIPTLGFYMEDILFRSISVSREIGNAVHILVKVFSPET